MFRVNKKSTKATIRLLDTIGITLCVAIAACMICDSKEAVPHQWQVAHNH